jgi:hypothetical protein
MSQAWPVALLPPVVPPELLLPPDDSPACPALLVPASDVPDWGRSLRPEQPAETSVANTASTAPARTTSSKVREPDGGNDPMAREATTVLVARSSDFARTLSSASVVQERLQRWQSHYGKSISEVSALAR